MKLKHLLDGIIDDSLITIGSIEVKGIELDSREIKLDFLFVAINGALQHGLVFAEQAKHKGANVIIYDPLGADDFDLSALNIPCVAIEHLNLKLGGIADCFYQCPSKKLEVIGITGTNGKTTCSQFLLQLIPECGVIGTLGWGEGNNALNETLNTTPDALTVQKILAHFVALTKQTAVMEVSSHGLEQGRVNEVQFKGAVFTNLTQDHLDYHGSMEQYLQAKLALFKRPELKFVVVNLDDESSEVFLSAAQKEVKRWAFSATAKKHALTENVTASRVTYSLSGLQFEVCWKTETVAVQTKIVGDFNLDNILTVITVLLAQGDSLQNAVNKVGELQPITGRMECFGGQYNQPFIFVDYAHTPDALEKVLLGLRKYSKNKLRVVFGCGGNRDQSKRVKMGQVADRLADHVIVTNDNPRFEAPEQIIKGIEKGCISNHYEIIQDRATAIQTVIKRAFAGDCILIAGKGHENYQEIKGIKQPFSDQMTVQNALLDRENQIMQMLLSEIALCTSGFLIGADLPISSISIDTRTLAKGALYIAIKGQNFDGHSFIKQAENAEASAVLVEFETETKVPQIIVNNAHLALAELAAAWKHKANVQTIAVTGSNGKTTVKEMIAAILAIHANVHFTQGNLNNDIGVPLTLLKLQEDDQYAVVEMGANHLGEIAYSSRYAKADVAVITNVGMAHIEGFGSLEGVARAKGEIILGLGSAGVAVLNRDDAFYPLWQELAGDRTIYSFGLSQGSAVRAEQIEVLLEKKHFMTRFVLSASTDSIDIELGVVGQHNVLNALAAAASCLSLGIELTQIKQGLECFTSVQGRLQPLIGLHGGLVIDDTYNANPNSVHAALEVLVQSQGEPWVILGALGEMGVESKEIHEALGRTIKAVGVKRLFAMGTDAKFTANIFGVGASYYDTQEQLIMTLKNELKGGESLLVKGSRSQNMENVVATLVKDFRV